MKESRLYLQFFRSYFLVLLVTAIIGLGAGFWFVSQQKDLFVSERMFEFPYTYENAAAVEKKSEEAVTILRSPQLKEQLGMQVTQVVIFRPGPFAIKIQTKGQNAESSINNLDKLSSYAMQSYPIREIGTEVSFIERDNPWKWICLGLFGGLGTGLLLSLIFSYLKNY